MLNPAKKILLLLVYGCLSMKREKIYLLVNFGGPRDLSEVEEFLICLFRDQEVLRTPFPGWIHRLLFTRLAKKRARLVVHDYARIGGGSPIYRDTEQIAQKLSSLLGQRVLTFHRYLPSTHLSFIQSLQLIGSDSQIRVFPLFAQFSYATTGSIAKWFTDHLEKSIVDRMRWIKSYCIHSAYIDCFVKQIQECLEKNGCNEAQTILLFSAHGVPIKFIETGDVYESQCQQTFKQLSNRFPKALSRLCYQSQWGKEPWITPYTLEMCHTIDRWGRGFKDVVVIPLSFTSDHIETLFEVEEQYLPPLAERGFRPIRCPALNQRPDWIKAIAEIIQQEDALATHKLLRKASTIDLLCN